jgi:hypothetical protein
MGEALAIDRVPLEKSSLHVIPEGVGPVKPPAAFLLFPRRGVVALS